MNKKKKIIEWFPRVWCCPWEDLVDLDLVRLSRLDEQPLYAHGKYVAEGFYNAFVDPITMK